MGTTVAACFADLGHNVVNIDIGEAIVEAINAGRVPAYELRIQDLITKHAARWNRMPASQDLLRRRS